MADDFDPNAYLAQQGAAAPPPAVDPLDLATFDPNAYLNDKEATRQALLQSKYGSVPQQALAGVQGLGKGLAGPAATAVYAGLNKAGVPGFSPEEQAGLEEANPMTSGVAEGVGLLAPAIASGGLFAAARAGLEIPEAASIAAKALGKYSYSGALGALGEGAGKALVPAGMGAISKIGSAAVAGAVENATFMAGDIGSQIINGADPQGAVESALPYVGLSALIGGGLGGGIGSVSSLWRATYGKDLGGVLGAISNKLGGTGDIVSDPVRQALETVGIQPKPEIIAAMASDPQIQGLAKVLEQTASNGSGLEYQAALEDFHTQAKEIVANTFGTTSEELSARPKISTHDTGVEFGNVLGNEAEEQVAPLRKGYEDRAEQFKGKDLAPTIAEKADTSRVAIQKASDAVDKATKGAIAAQKSGDVAGSIDANEKLGDANAALKAAQDQAEKPGTKDILSDQLAQLALKNEWTLSPESKTMQAVNSIQRELQNPGFKTLNSLTEYIKSIKEKLPFDPFNGQLNHNAGEITKIFRQTEGELIGQHIGSEEGQDALDKYVDDRAKYRAASDVKEQLEQRVGKLGSTSGYPDMIKEKATAKGESFLSKMSGKKDAGLLTLLQNQFPKSYEYLRQYHLANLLQDSTVKGEFNLAKLQKNVSEMSPELKAMVVPGDAAQKLDGMKILQDQLNKQPHNFSNTARTLSAMNQHGISTAMGMLAYLTGHGAAASLLVGQVSKYLSKNAPDAIRLGLLKFLGSSKGIEPGAFKALVDFIHSSAKGENAVQGASRALFKTGSQVIPEHLVPKDSDLDILDERLKKLNNNPNGLEDVASNVGHYLPNHQIAMMSVAHNAVGYLNGIRPTASKTSPLDQEVEPSDAQKSNYRNALTIAQQPLSVLQSIKDNTLTSGDVAHLKALYPSHYAALSKQITDEMLNHTSKGNIIPFPMRFGLSTLLGQPLDSSFAPQNVASNQMTHAQSTQQQQQANAPKTSKVGMRQMKTADRFSLSHSDETG